ncbi:MAG: ATP-binding cassette domain-containing protein [Paracoccus sp. (in: a-proteobacteria)]|nr:ATP-binding cassette domain-containing protein [Paracoccus sp. (in: a-proteobacteria)]
MNAIEFDCCSVAFGKRPAEALRLADQGLDRAEIRARSGQVLGVHDATLCVAEGEIVVLMGLSGSGKSTLLRAVNGLNPVTRGDVRLSMNGAMISVPRADRATLHSLRLGHVSMVFQQFGLLPWRSVADNVGLGLELAGIAPAARRARVAAQLAAVGLEGWADRPVSELSGGMQQRVGLARAFATDAPVLLMDEPFSALDPLIRGRLQDELLTLQQTMRRTILFVSHDLDEAFRLGHRIALMEEGRIVQTGTPREIMLNPATRYVAEFTANMNPLDVLTAADIATSGQAGGEPLPPATSLRALLDILAGTEARPLAGGGIVTREALLRRLAAGERG